jgi:DNA-binding transcriptional LysR family regulator
MTALVGAGKGIFPVPERTSRYYTRPDITYVPIRDTQPFEWALIWRTVTETETVRAFSQTARDIAKT